MEFASRRRTDALFEEIFRETLQRIEGLPPGLERFEKTSLLEGMTGSLASRRERSEVSLMCESLVNTLGANPSTVEVARVSYFADIIVEWLKARGFTETVGPEVDEALGLDKGLADASMKYLCQLGLLSLAPDGSYRETMELWSEEVTRVRGHLKSLLGGFEELRRNQRSNFADLGREYRRLLSLAKQTSEELRVFGQAKPAEAIRRRSEGEERHFNKHHPGPWIPHMADEYYAFLKGHVDMLPPELSVRS